MKQSPIDKLKMMLVERPWAFQTGTLLAEMDKLIKFINHYSHRIITAKGSTHNHQNWEGGYIDHLILTLCSAYNIYPDMMNEKPDLNVDLFNVKRVIFFHDIEKIFRDIGFNKEHFLNYNLPAEFNIKLTPEELDAIHYIHGEGDDYRKDKRVMSELCAICHCADVLSARVLWDCKVT